LKEELMLLKGQAQELEEDFPTRFAFNGASLLMRAKGGDGFNWIMHNHWLTVAVNRSSKAQILAQVRCSSAYLWRKRDLGQIIVDVHQFLMSIFGQYIVLHVSSCGLAVDVTGLDLSSVQQVKEHFVSRAQLTGLMPSSAKLRGRSQFRQARREIGLLVWLNLPSHLRLIHNVRETVIAIDDIS